MKNVKDVVVGLFTAFGVMVLGMMGGQGKIGGKGTRRFGIPGLALLVAMLYRGFKWRYLSLLLLIPVLIMGYGKNSWLLSVVNHEWLVRLVYAICLSTPFIFFGVKRWAASAVLLCAAFSVHAGSLGTVAWFGDFLIEDIVRYGVLGGIIAYNIVKK